MAYTYLKDNSPFIYIRYKTAEGKWRSKATEYRRDNKGDVFQAEILADEMGIAERKLTVRLGSEEWDAWVEGWLNDRYGAKKMESTTFTVYSRYWRRFRKWLQAEQVSVPRQLNFGHIQAYKAMREEDDTGINTIIHELKFLGVVMGEAMRRRYVTANPCLRMGFQRATPASKVPWKDAEIAKVAAAITKEPDWMQATFYLGLYQAARLRQCEVPLRDIDLKRNRISYWRSLSDRPLTKGDKPFAQPIAKSAAPLLRDLIARRQAAGHASLCDIPEIPSVYWRGFLLSLDLGHLCHHGLRTTWITRAAQSGKISRAEAMAFVNHGSTAVHEIYQRLHADDVAHVADALDLPAIAEPPARRPAKRGNAAKPCNGPES